MFQSGHLIVPAFFSLLSPLVFLREANVHWGCFCTVQVFVLLLCGDSDSPRLPLLFITYATDHITHSRRPLTQRGIQVREKQEK